MSTLPPTDPAAHAIFMAALERLLPEERAAFLDEACAGNAPLRAAVEALLLEYKESIRGQTVTGGFVAKVPLSEGPGTMIGRYKLLQKIGEGGCGVVFMAEQTQPVQRRVALKIIRLGMDTEEVVARFEAERQALAMMEHPHIAQVLDAGATPAGRPYFVMELVRGVPITKFCDDHHLNTAARLKLFVQVCQAVQHAHQKGVIHRDLKPSNILVTLHDGVPVPKVIDFGIAKATAGRLTDKTLFTAFEQFVGTPAYMSPEQAEMSNLDVDTRSDVYSLGVLLYELLTGQPPLDPDKLHSAGVDEIRRQIREVEAVRPSTQLATLVGATLTTRASLHGTDATKFVSSVRGDLDWIVMRCLEKDRRRRYDSASALAEDIARHLKNEPITARPPGNLYLLQKLARRHRAAFVTVSAVSLALIVGFGAALRSYFSEKAARKTAEEQSQRADEQSVLASKSKADMLVALSRADYLVALDLLGRDRDPEAVAHLVRALRAKPDDRATATLLASVLTMRAWLVPVTPANTPRQPVVTPPRGGGPQGRAGQPNPGGLRGTRGGRRGGLGPVQQSNIPSPDGKWILRSLQLENAARLYDTAASPLKPVAEPLRLASDMTGGSVSDDGRRVTTITREIDAGKPQIWQREEAWDFPISPARLLALRDTGAVALAAWSPDGRVVFTATADGSARTWSADTGRGLSVPMHHDQPVREAVFSADGKRLATLTQENALRVWDAATGQPVTASIAEETRPGGSGGRGPPNARGGSVSFSPDGKLILVSVAGRFARVRDAATGQPVPVLKNLEAAPVGSVALSPDGRRILTTTVPPPPARGAAPGSTPQAGAQIWDAATGEVVLEFAKDAGQLNSAAFSPDGRLVVTASSTGQAHLWDATTGEPESDLMALGEGNLWALFSPDGKRVLTYTRGQERAARVWDAATGEPVSALIQMEPVPNTALALAAPFSAAFSPDGRWVVTEGAGSRIWDAATGLAVSVPLAGEGAAFHPEGKHLLTVGADGSANVTLFADEIGPAWILDLAEALARCRFDATSSPEFFPGRPIEELRRRAAEEKDLDQPMVVWARRLLGLTP